MRSFTFGPRALALSVAPLLALLVAPLATPAQVGIQLGTNRRAQRGTSTHPRRETNANRRARIAREIAETYSHRYEVSAGGGYLRFRSGEFLQKNNEVTFFGSTTYYLNPKLGILGDVHGAYGNAKIGNNIFNLQNPQISQYAFTGGPSYRFIAQRKFALSGFATGGVAYGKFGGGTKAILPERVGIWSTAWRPAFTAGVNFDYNFFPNLAVRIAPTYVGTLFQRNAVDDPALPVNASGSSLQNNFGLNVGLVYRFGRQK